MKFSMLGLFVFATALSAVVMVSNNESTNSMSKYTNKLVEEKSPYLLQHAHNPVNWYAWGEEAFARALKEDKPIFLSIGYSTCHWCHVMEHESFEDEDVAELMNQDFIAIKVDREERPDLDNVYMTVCQMMTGSGGWPLTIIMTPDKKPFFAGTYIPKQSRYGRMGMMELLPRVAELWRDDRQKLLKSADKIVAHLSDSAVETAGAELGADLLDQTFQDLKDRYDELHGGFGEKPKFPTPHNILFLLRHHQRSGDKKALAIVEKTLVEMSRGGIYDHIGFGFHRYSTDQEWLLPHFEKMLYDQAMLILAYSEAWQATKNPDFAKTAREIIAYVLRDMTDENGGFYSAEDADSDGEEGKFYVWTQDEIERILGEDAAWFTKFYNVEKNGNFVDEATQQKSGVNILHLRDSLSVFAAESKIPLDTLRGKIESAREKLYLQREKRIHPYKDDKILTDWNGLMIAALAAAGRIFEEPRYIESASKAQNFISQNMLSKDGRLLHRYRDGDAAIRGFAGDYAFYIWGLVELFQATQKSEFLEQALMLNDAFIADFWDEKDGGFFTTSDDGEVLLIRDKEIYDGAIPSANSVALYNLIRLARITGRVDLEEKSNLVGAAFSLTVNRSPSAYTFLMSALNFAAGPAYEIVIVGNPTDDSAKAMMKALTESYLPNSVLIVRQVGASEGIDKLSSFVRGYNSMDGKATAYVCQNYSCQLPTNDVSELLIMLGKGE
jgi:uncharacterized protein